MDHYDKNIVEYTFFILCKLQFPPKTAIYCDILKG